MRFPDRAPAFVTGPNGLVSWLLRKGVPMGPNGLLTVRGRASGKPRSAPVAVSDMDGRRYIVGAYGDVNWTRNLRAAGEAEISLHGRTERVYATELDRGAAEDFFRATVPAYMARFPWIGRVLLRFLFNRVAPDFLADPAKAAATRPVFELSGVPKPLFEATNAVERAVAKPPR